jgi:REP element-mobilizing transposase RayT
MPQSFTSLHYHIIFSTKDRVASITHDVQQRLYDYMGGIVRAQDGKLIAAGGTADHVHLLVSLGKQIALADVVRNIKSNSSKWVKETFPTQGAFAWQTGYAAFTVSLSSQSHVKRYIANQAEHHRTRSFGEELIEFLKRHEIPFDERYLAG